MQIPCINPICSLCIIILGITRYAVYNYRYSLKCHKINLLLCSISSLIFLVDTIPFSVTGFFLAGRVTRFRGLQILWIFLWWLGVVEGWCGCRWISANLSVRGSAQWVPRGMRIGRVKQNCRINYRNKYRINSRNQSKKFKLMKKALFYLIHERTNCSVSLGKV